MDANTASPVASSVSSALKVVWWLPLLRGLLLIILGVLIMMEPLGALRALTLVVGAFLLADGLIVILDGWLHRRQEGWKMWLIQGCVDIAIAIIIIVWPTITVAVFFYLLIIWTITLGVVAVIGSAALARNKDLAWPWLLAFGLVSVMFGVMLLMRGQDFANTLAVVGLVLSIYAFIAGSIQIVSAFSVRAMARDIDQALKGESGVLNAIQERQVTYAAQSAQRAAEREAEKEAERQQREVEKAQRAAATNEPVAQEPLSHDPLTGDSPAGEPDGEPHRG